MSVDATEHNTSGVARLDEPTAYLYGEKGELTAELLRAVAAELLNAADMLDGVTAPR